MHRLSLLLVIENEINSEADVDLIRRTLEIASTLKISEVAVAGEVLEPARRRLSVAGLLNGLSAATLQPLLKDAKRLAVRLTHRYAVDDESAARTI